MSRFTALLALLIAPSIAGAHFPWLYVTEDSRPRLFFGESVNDRDYHLPDSVSDAEVWQSGIDAPAKQLEMSEHEEEGFIGLEGEDEIEPRGRVTSRVEYGVYHGSKLVYYAQHFPSENPQTWPTDAGDGPLQARVEATPEELLVTALWKGEPLADQEISLQHEDGDDAPKATTDADGVARFPIDAVADGLSGFTVMHTDKDDKGEVDGESYVATMHILTATFNYSREAAAKVAALPALPEAVASFGAAVSDGWLYVYGGHIGQAHDHSRENLSAHFRRARLDGSTGWEDLPSGPALQGLPLVAHDGKLYRVGGLDARNATGEEEDLHSTDGFACYDPATGAWTDLPALPKPRSSHNAVVLGDTLYVVGGWTLSGDNGGEWQAGALAFDLAHPEAGWVELAEPPFKRRALAVGQLDGRVVALCGMTDDADLSKQVFFYDPAEKAWSEGPEFPGNPFHGFGLSAWNVDGALYAGGMQGVLYRLDGVEGAWTEAADFATKRFFHQLVPDGRGGLLAVAGASPEVGHTATIERLELSADPAVDKTAKPVAHTAASR